MKSQGSDEFAIIIDPDDLENLTPCQISHRQRPSLKTTREITRFVRRYQRRLSFTPPSTPLHHSLNAKNTLPAIKRGDDDSESGSNEADEEERELNSLRCQNNKRNSEADLSRLHDYHMFLSNGSVTPSAYKCLIEDRRHSFQTIEMLQAKTLSMQDSSKIHPKVVPQLPPIGMSSAPCRPVSPLPSQRRKHSCTSNSDGEFDEWTEGKEEEERKCKDVNVEDDTDFDKTMYFGHGDEVVKIIL